MTSENVINDFRGYSECNEFDQNYFTLVSKPHERTDGIFSSLNDYAAGVWFTVKQIINENRKSFLFDSVSTAVIRSALYNN